MKAFAGVRHVSFDLWLTIIKSHKQFKPARSSLLRRFFDIQKSDEAVFEAVTRYDRLFNGINETTGGNMDTSEIVLVILDALGAGVKHIDTRRLDGFYEAMEQLFFEYPPVLLDEKIPAYLLQLQQAGFTTSILSNTAFIKGKTLDVFLKQAGLFDCFNFRLYSDELGFSKPNPLVFEALFEEAGKLRPVSRTEIMHIGDNEKADYLGAVDAGMKAVLVKGDGSGWPVLFN
jgi:putative hydrolase of the HAD superfamily